MIEKALAIDPQSAEAFAALGLARLQIGQVDAAESALRQAMELNEDYVPAHLWLANVLSAQGRYAEIDRLLQHSMTIDPLNELLAVSYALNLSVRGEWEEAKTVMQRLIDLRPASTLLLRSMSGRERRTSTPSRSSGSMSSRMPPMSSMVARRTSS